jgi:tellurite resistance protein
MSVSFTVSVRELPPFVAVVGASQTIDPVQLTGAGWTGHPWPKGLFAKIVDAASAPTKMELTPELEASFARAGIHGSFIAWTRGAARGVVIGRTNDTLTLHVPVLASAPDYLLAAGLAAAVAKLANTTVNIDDPGQPDGAGHKLTPDAVLAQWTQAAAEAHARQFGTWLVDDIAAGRGYFFQGPHGVIEITQSMLDGLEGEARFDKARALLVGEEAIRGLSMPAVPPSEDGRREAVLLTAAMVFAAGADGVLADEEARQLEAHFATVEELAAFAAPDLMQAVRSEVSGIVALGELGSLALRRKAFVLAAEVIASARDGKLGGEPSDPNVRAVSAIAKALFLDDDQVFLAQVVRTVNTKYEDARGDETFAQDLTTAMVLVAAADGHIEEKETAVLSALARTVPDLKRRDVGSLFTAARMRIQGNPETALDAVTPAAKEKCFTLAAEVALVTGLSAEGTILPKLARQLAPNYPDAAIATFAAKYS